MTSLWTFETGVRVFAVVPVGFPFKEGPGIVVYDTEEDANRAAEFHGANQSTIIPLDVKTTELNG